ncbi:YSIRK-type signal peptide-containing protein [Dolosigranulum pigrum]|uniref:GA-like domain-containing protein n=1 Tax=Dolosigranulum pigrum TaxID=29394 RepID=UPI001AD89C3C|nr:YSIRK-type signal peptide-containing protein [Dolosigranulum pigrum]QTJ47963.1 YSIRK-type signal peptide-containing protein [Dolosigranulum pigrum]
MVGKNNKKLLMEMGANKFKRYTLKKLSIGVASVSIGIGLMFGATEQVSAQAEAGTVIEHDEPVNQDITPQSEQQEPEIDHVLEAKRQEVNAYLVSSNLQHNRDQFKAQIDQATSVSELVNIENRINEAIAEQVEETEKNNQQSEEQEQKPQDTQVSDEKQSEELEKKRKAVKDELGKSEIVIWDDYLALLNKINEATSIEELDAISAEIRGDKASEKQDEKEQEADNTIEQTAPATPQQPQVDVQQNTSKPEVEYTLDQVRHFFSQEELAKIEAGQMTIKQALQKALGTQPDIKTNQNHHEENVLAAGVENLDNKQEEQTGKRRTRRNTRNVDLNRVFDKSENFMDIIAYIDSLIRNNYITLEEGIMAKRAALRQYGNQQNSADLRNDANNKNKWERFISGDIGAFNRDAMRVLTESFQDNIKRSPGDRKRVEEFNKMNWLIEKIQFIIKNRSKTSSQQLESKALDGDSRQAKSIGFDFSSHNIKGPDQSRDNRYQVDLKMSANFNNNQKGKQLVYDVYTLQVSKSLDKKIVGENLANWRTFISVKEEDGSEAKGSLERYELRDGNGNEVVQYVFKRNYVYGTDNRAVGRKIGDRLTMSMSTDSPIDTSDSMITFYTVDTINPQLYVDKSRGLNTVGVVPKDQQSTVNIISKKMKEIAIEKNINEARTAVEEAEAAAQAAEAKLTEVTADGTVTEADRQAVIDANNQVTAAKSNAQTALDNVPEGTPGKGDLTTRLGNVSTVEAPEVNDRDGNGVADEEQLASARTAVEEAEAAAQAAEAKLTEVTADGTVTEADRQAVIDANNQVTAAKSNAQTALDNVPEGTPGKGDLTTRLGNVSTVEAPEVNDRDGNGVADEEQLASARTAVEEAEAAAQAAEAKLTEVTADGTVTEADRQAVIDANNQVTAAKSNAQTALDNVPEGTPGKGDLTTRLGNVSTVEAPEVNDRDGNGVADEEQLASARTAVEEAEAAAQAAEAKLTEVTADGTVTEADRQAVIDANNQVTAAKSNAQTALDNVPEGTPGKGDLTTRLGNVSTVEAPEVNDRDGNGVADEEQLASARTAVEEAEAAAQAAEAKLTEVTADGTVTEADRQAVIDANNQVTAAKSNAQTALDNVPEGTPGKGDLTTRLGNVSTVEAPEVNDRDGNGVADEEQLASARTAVEEAEAAAQAAEAKLTEVTADGTVTEADRQAVIDANNQVTAAKSNAQTALDNVPEGTPGKGDLTTRLGNVSTVEAPEVNDRDGNGVADEEQLASARTAVEEAEAAAQAAEAKLTEVTADGTVTEADRQAVIDANNQVTAAKSNAQTALDNVPEGTPGKGDLTTRLGNVSTVEAPEVNDRDGNGVADEEQLASARTAVEEAEAAAQAAEAKLTEVTADGTVTEADRQAVIDANNQVTAAKSNAQTALDNVPEGTPGKGDLTTRLGNVSTVEAPEVNDRDGNGVADEEQLASARTAVEEAEAAAQAAEAKLTEVTADGTVTEADRQAVIDANNQVTAAKSNAQTALDNVPEGTPGKGDLTTRLGNVSTVEAPEVNDRDGNGVADEEQLASARTAVEEAEAAAQAKLTEVTADGTVTEADRQAVIDANNQVTAAKSNAQTALDNVPEGTPGKGDLTTRLGNVSTVEAPEVNDRDGNGVADEEQLASARTAVEEAEAAAQAAEAKLTEVTADGTVTEADRQAVIDANNQVTAAKSNAQTALDNVPEGTPGKGDLTTRLGNVSTVEAPEVNDRDGNGVADEEQLASARTAVEEAEAAAQAAEAKLTEVTADGTVTEADRQAVIDANNQVTAAKSNAQTALDNVPEGTPGKGDLTTRLGNVSTVEAPEVNDRDGNGVADEEQLASARTAVEEAEAAAQAAEAKLTEVTADGTVTEADRQAVIDANNQVTAAKSNAQTALDNVPEGTPGKGDLTTRLGNVSTVEAPEVNDRDGNGVADEEQLASARTAVEEAEAAAQAAEAKLTEVTADGTVTEADRQAVIDANNQVTAAKSNAQTALDNVPEGTPGKGDLTTRLGNVSTVEAPEVNDRDGNGVADEEQLASARTAVEEAEAAAQAAEAKLTEVTADGTVTEADRQAVIDANNQVTAAKSNAQTALDNVPEGTPGKGDLTTRLGNVSTVEAPEVNDRDGNGVADEEQLASARTAVEEAEAAAQAAEAKLTEVTADGTVTEADRQAVIDANNQVTAAKSNAQTALDNVPEGTPGKGDLTTRLGNVSTVEAPEVNDRDGNGVADEEQLASARTAVEEAEAAAQAAEAKLTEVTADGTVTEADRQAVIDANNQVTAAKSNAQTALDNVPEGTPGKGDLTTRLGNVSTVEAPEVNDRDGNGVADEEQLASARTAVEEAEAAAQAAEAKLTEVTADGTVTEADRQAVIDANNQVTAAKSNAQTALDNVPEGTPGKGDLTTRLGNVSTVEAPEVNDRDGNGVADEEQLASARTAVEEAEAAAQAAEAKLTEVTADGTVTEADRQAVIDANNQVTAAKSNAQTALDNVPEGTPGKGDLTTRLGNVSTVEAPEVNDRDGNGVADEEQLASARTAVEEAEAAAQAAEAKLTEVTADGTVTEADRQAVIDANNQVTAAKSNAQTALDNVPEGTPGKGDLTTRLGNVSTVEAPEVNDRDGNGVADEEQLASARTAVEEAEAAAQAAEAKLTEVTADGTVTEADRQAVIDANNQVTAAKSNAQTALDNVPEGTPGKGDLTTRLGNVSTVEAPEVNDRDGNGIADDTEWESGLGLINEKPEFPAEELERLLQVERDKAADYIAGLQNLDASKVKEFQAAIQSAQTVPAIEEIIQAAEALNAKLAQSTPDSGNGAGTTQPEKPEFEGGVNGQGLINEKPTFPTEEIERLLQVERDKAADYIASLPNLDISKVNEFKVAIQNAQTVPAIEEIIQTAEALNTELGRGKVGGEQEQPAEPEAPAQSGQAESERPADKPAVTDHLQNAKTQAEATINSLSHLTRGQKNQFIASVQAATTVGQIHQIVEEARYMNGQQAIQESTKQANSGERLPETATGSWLLGLSGISSLLVGLGLKKKREDDDK